MKATLFATVLSLSILSCATPCFAENTLPTAPAEAGQALKKINLNTADAKALTHSFKGIGQKRAEAIVSYRDTEGHFKSVADLAHVRGLGQSFVDSHLSELEVVFSVE